MTLSCVAGEGNTRLHSWGGERDASNGVSDNEQDSTGYSIISECITAKGVRLVCNDQERVVSKTRENKAKHLTDQMVIRVKLHGQDLDAGIIPPRSLTEPAVTV